MGEGAGRDAGNRRAHVRSLKSLRPAEAGLAPSHRSDWGDGKKVPKIAGWIDPDGFLTLTHLNLVKCSSI